MTKGSTSNLYEDIFLQDRNIFLERSKNLINIILSEVDEKFVFRVLESIGCKIERYDKKREKIEDIKTIRMFLDYAFVIPSANAIELNIRTGEIKYLEKVKMRGQRNYFIQKNPSDVSLENIKEFNKNISWKVRYLFTKSMSQYIPEETLDRIDVFLNGIYSKF